ncbi:thioesterase family protein [Candidatus Fermentibacterales bacterium]|nr:thioesterase family protein [Candidatus Fermentibacterales bacterium]
MDYACLVGREHTCEIVVSRGNTASAVGSGGVDVFATPSMILLMEQAAREAVQPLLPDGHTTVGTRVEVSHLAATPLGERVRATARVVAVDGRKLVYEVEARDEHTKVGEGRHERFVIDLGRFLAKLSQRSG